MTSATLCLEIVLLRYFSVSQQYHFAFLVVSIAFLGYGASGSFLSLFPKALSLRSSELRSKASLGFSLSVLLCFVLSNLIPFDLISISWDGRQILLIFFYYILLSIPFFFAGIVISSSISTYPDSVHKIYLADLTGAGCGTIMALFIFFPKGDQGTILIISIIALLASALFEAKPRLPSFMIKTGVLIMIITLYILSPAWLSFRISPFKSLPVALSYSHSERVLTRWNALSRVDIIRSPAVRYAPGLSLTYQGELPDQLGLTTDGEGLTAILSNIPPEDSGWDFLSHLPSAFPYHLMSKPKVLILNPSGGLDILSAYKQNSSQIDIIEKNPLVIKILTRDLGTLNGDFYQNKKLSFHVSTSRASLRQNKSAYDLVVYPLKDIFGASQGSISGFHEKYSFTSEAFQNVLESLKPEGVASMSFYILPPPRAELRILSTWIKVLESTNRDPDLHITAIRSWGTIHLFIKRSPFQADEINVLKEFCQNMLFDLVYYPGIDQSETNLFNQYDHPVFFTLFSKLLDKKQRKSLIRDYLFQIDPVTDDRPFFTNFFKVRKLKETFKALDRKWLPMFQGEPLILFLFFQSLVVALLFILIPMLIIQKRIKTNLKIIAHSGFYFGLIGMAFIFIEIALIQKFILFLGHPVSSSAVVIFSLLCSSGIGSLISKNIKVLQLEKMKRIMPLFCSLMAAATIFTFPLLIRICADLSLILKILMTSALIFPLGFFMGFPFPIGIRILNKTESKLIPWAWAVNAFSSVIHSILALLIAFHGGFKLVLISAAVGYVLTLPFLYLPCHGDKPNS